ncbi:hypothetical protein ARMGADRAFT_1011132 [Armillaria gallica]|uniref:Uncharacterized protein n=1 Tax=Armillaria gallica TaxID=47427 RepID=A0A2H3E6I4_ARMGA|nr:hypothetical protein ARMGADRAFT_1011132 [Armillaria gallica]
MGSSRSAMLTCLSTTTQKTLAVPLIGTVASATPTTTTTTSKTQFRWGLSFTNAENVLFVYTFTVGTPQWPVTR